MSFQSTPSHPQTKQPLLSCDHASHDGFLATTLTPITLDLFNNKQSPPQLEFLDNFPKMSLEDHDSEDTMNRKNGNKVNVPKLDLRLNLSPPSSTVMFNLREESQSRSPSLSPTNSCVSSEMSSPEAMTMVLVGCPRCLMYVMLSEDDPKCPKCKSTVLLGFHHDNNYYNNCGNNNDSSKKTRKS